MKSKLFLFICFLLVFQTVFSSTYLPVEERGSVAGEKVEHQILFEENDYSPFVFGEVPTNQGRLLVNAPDNSRLNSNFNSKDLHIAIIQSILSTTVTQGKTIYFGCSGFYIINIPIYLQTDQFLL